MENKINWEVKADMEIIKVWEACILDRVPWREQQGSRKGIGTGTPGYEGWSWEEVKSVNSDGKCKRKWDKWASLISSVKAASWKMLSPSNG